MKSLTKTRSFLPSVLNAESNSGSVYSFTVNECIGPRPLANHRTLTFKTSDNETIFSADSEGSLSLSHFLTTCGLTPTRLANESVSTTPAASIAAFSLNPNVDIFSPHLNKAGEIHLAQDREKKFSHILSFNKFCFAAASQSCVPPRKGLMFPTLQCLPDGRGLFLIHKASVPFFRQKLIGNSTINEGLFK